MKFKMPKNLIFNFFQILARYTLLCSATSFVLIPGFFGISKVQEYMGNPESSERYYQASKLSEGVALSTGSLTVILILLSVAVYPDEK